MVLKNIPSQLFLDSWVLSLCRVVAVSLVLCLLPDHRLSSANIKTTKRVTIGVKITKEVKILIISRTWKEEFLA